MQNWVSDFRENLAFQSYYSDDQQGWSDIPYGRSIPVEIIDDDIIRPKVKVIEIKYMAYTRPFLREKLMSPLKMASLVPQFAKKKTKTTDL